MSDKENFTFAYSNSFSGVSYTHSVDSDEMTAMELYSCFLEWAKMVYGWNIEEQIKNFYVEECS